MSSFESYGISDLFTMEGSTANLYSQGGKSGGGEAILEQGQTNIRRVGRSNATRNHADLFPNIDIPRALQKDISVNCTLDRKMSTKEAGVRVTEILNKCGMTNEGSEYSYAFIKSMLICMASNSSSNLVPGRAKFYVGESEFDFFADVIGVLRRDARRFFRAYADVTRDYLKDLEREANAGPRSEDEADLKRYNDAVQMWDNIIEVAEGRGLQRVPYLVHDSAESCTGKTAVETLYLANCKSTIFANDAYLGNLVDNPVVSNTKGSSRMGGPVVSSAGHGASSMPEGF